MRFFGKKPSSDEPEDPPAWMGDTVSSLPAIRADLVERPPTGAHVLPDEMTIRDELGERVRWVTTKSQAKSIIAGLKIEKKDWQLSKKDVALTMQQERAEYRTKNARRSHTHGRGQVNSMFRTFEQMGRDNARRSHANRLSPLEQRKAAIDQMIQFIDRVVLDLERFALTLPDEPKPARSRPAAVCPTCGATKKRGDRFCGECGAEFGPQP